MTFPTPTTRTRLEALFDALDYDRLAPIYCDDGGDSFWAAHRQPALEMGLEWAAALADRLGAGRSLYVGAGVAELPCLVVETLDLDRQVRACTLDGDECEVLTAALAAVDLADRVRFEHQDATACAADGGFDHVSLVSVLNDPVRYPMVSGLSYGRLPPVALDVASFEDERGRLRALCAALLDGIDRPGLVTTTFEEVAWLLDAAAGRGLHVEAEDVAIQTAIVGDPLGFLRVTATP